MEHSAFDLNAALEQWRQELAAQLCLAGENRRELETHLLDCMAGLRGQGLAEEESFWLARRRMGQPQPLAAEFFKSDPAKVWRESVFWGALALLTVDLWQKISSLLWVMCVATFRNNNYSIPLFPDWVRFYLPFLPSKLTLFDFWLLFFESNLILLPLVGIAFFLSRGKLIRVFSRTQFILQSRGRFWIASSALFLPYAIWVSLAWFRRPYPNQNWIQMMAMAQLLFPIMLMAIIGWLLPSHKPKQTVSES